MHLFPLSACDRRGHLEPTARLSYRAHPSTEQSEHDKSRHLSPRVSPFAGRVDAASPSLATEAPLRHAARHFRVCLHEVLHVGRSEVCCRCEAPRSRGTQTDGLVEISPSTNRIGFAHPSVRMLRIPTVKPIREHSTPNDWLVAKTVLAERGRRMAGGIEGSLLMCRQS